MGRDPSVELDNPQTALVGQHVFVLTGFSTSLDVEFILLCPLIKGYRTNFETVRYF